MHASRPTLLGLEAHLVQIHKMIAELDPRVVILDPISNLISAGTSMDASAMLVRLIDVLKTRNITAYFTHLSGDRDAVETTDVGVSSLIDTWILMRHIEVDGERNRGLYVLKSRGMKHSNQVHEFLLTDRGIELREMVGERKRNAR